MLVLGVTTGDYVMIDDNIKIRVIKTGSTYRLAIDAPKEMTILRKSLYEQQNPDADDTEYERMQSEKKRKKKASVR